MNYTEQQIKLAGLLQPDGGSRDFGQDLEFQGEGIRSLGSNNAIFEENTGECCDDLLTCEILKGELIDENEALQGENDDLQEEIDELQEGWDSIADGGTVVSNICEGILVGNNYRWTLGQRKYWTVDAGSGNLAAYSDPTALWFTRENVDDPNNPPGFDGTNCAIRFTYASYVPGWGFNISSTLAAMLANGLVDGGTVTLEGSFRPSDATGGTYADPTPFTLATFVYTAPNSFTTDNTQGSYYYQDDTTP